MANYIGAMIWAASAKDILLNEKVWLRLWQGLLVTIQISFIAIAISLVLGILLGILMTSQNRAIKIITKILLEIVRIVPILVWLFVFFFGITKALNIHIDAFLISIIVFSIWGTFETGDIVRAAITSIPTIQTESGKSIALTENQVKFYIILPQAAKRMIPSLINLSTRMIKTSSLVSLIGVIEFVKVGQQLTEVLSMQNSDAAFWIYAILFIGFFVICYPLSLLSRYLEKKWNVE